MMAGSRPARWNKMTSPRKSGGNQHSGAPPPSAAAPSLAHTGGVVVVPAMRTLVPLFCFALLGNLGFSASAHAATPTLLGQSKGAVNNDPGRVKQNIPVKFAPRKPGPAPAKAQAPATTDPAVLSLERFGASIQRAVLDNGLKVVMNPDHSAPTVAVSVTYKVGSSSEVSGRTGFAHLFEHMMFQGSKHAPKG